MWERTATELAAGIRSGEFSAREVVESHLERIAAVNPRVNAIVTLLEPELALKAADEAPPGVLHGLPIAVKDLEDTAGMRTTYGSALFADNIPTTDSLLVERLRAAGAVVIGKTNAPEFGAGSQTFNAVFGPTRNPYDLTKTPGGSSGGAAAAVAAGMIPFADGSDLGASVRNPASFCNLIGLRPTAGPDPRRRPGRPVEPVRRARPDRPHARGRRPALPRARRPRPARPALDPRAVPDPRPAHRPARPARSPGAATSAACRSIPRSRRVLEQRRQTLEDLGCIVEDAEPDFDGADECFEVLRGVTFAGAFADIAEQVKPTLAENIRFGQALTAPRIARALELRGELFTRMREFLTRYDLFVAPVTQVAPFDVETEYPTEIAGVPMGSYLEWFRSCSRITVTAHPAIALPAGFTPDGLPLGLQVVGRHRGELELLRFAHAFTEATGLAARRPTL